MLPRTSSMTVNLSPGIYGAGSSVNGHFLKTEAFNTEVHVDLFIIIWK